MQISPKVTKISPKVMQISPKVSIQQHALKGQKLLAQGNALGNHGRKFVALKGQKLSSTRQFTKLLPLQGALLRCHYTQGDALG